MATARIQIRKRGAAVEITPPAARRARIAKLDNERQIVFGWANVCVACDGETVVDSHDDTIEVDELENAAYNYNLNFGGSGGAMGSNHTGVAKGRLIESVFFTKEKLAAMNLPTDAVHQGWWVGFYVANKAAWEKVKKGHYKMFSIQGKARRKENA